MREHFIFFSPVAKSLLLTVGLASAAEPPRAFHFDLDASPAVEGHIKVPASAIYSQETGFGFDLGTRPSQLDWGVTGATPFFFSLALPEGNYRVTARLGDSSAACMTTIKAESRRLMIEHLRSAAGERKR
jgi:hypothetical protein